MDTLGFSEKFVSQESHDMRILNQILLLSEIFLIPFDPLNMLHRRRVAVLLTPSLIWSLRGLVFR